MKIKIIPAVLLINLSIGLFAQTQVKSLYERNFIDESTLTEQQHMVLESIKTYPTTKAHDLIEIDITQLKNIHSLAVKKNNADYIFTMHEPEIIKNNVYVVWGTGEKNGDHIMLSIYEDAVTGFWTTNNTLYNLYSLGDGINAEVELAPQKYVTCKTGSLYEIDNILQQQEMMPNNDVKLNTNALKNIGHGYDRVQSGATIKLLVVYTTAAKNEAGGQSAIESIINAAISAANTSFSNSQITGPSYVAYSHEVNYTAVNTEQGPYLEECSGVSNDKYKSLVELRDDDDGKMDEVHDLRGMYAADVVVLLVKNSALSVNGEAWSVPATSAGNAFCVVRQNAASANGAWSMPHEIGHLIGCRHELKSDPELCPEQNVHGYNYGDIDNKYQTIMAVEGGRKRELYWSNPSVSSHGYSTGSLDGLSKAYNANVVEERQGFLAGVCAELSGTLSSNKTIYKPTSLSNVVVPSGKQLTINANKDVFIKTGNLQINFGGTLQIGEGATLVFLPNTGLIINGTLDANGTSSNKIVFRRNTAYSGSWNGIDISGTSATSSELLNCEIKDASTGIDISNSAPLIEKCYVHSCSSYPLKLTSGATPKVLNNKFYAGSTHAVYISSAGGDFGANEFRTSSGTTYGVYITGSTANPNFDNKWGDGGNLFDLANISSHGAYAAGGYPEFGSHGAREGENDFINRGSSNYIYNNTGSTIDAEYNFWDGTPQSSWFGGSIDYNPYESSSNGAGPSWKVMVSPFQPGLTKYEEGNYAEALAELKLALEQNEESDDAAGAVFKMAMSAFKTGVLDEQETFLIGLSNSVNPEVQHMSRIWLAYLYFQQKKLDQAEKTALLAPVGSLAERSELLALVSYYSTLGDADAAIRIAEILQSHHKDDYLAFDLGEAAHTKLVFQDNLSKTGAKKNPDYHFSTYPNPFNPSTTIQFNLSTDDHITLQIFDMLGRHVQTLINRDMPAGFHSVKWNGRNSKGKEAAAGIYLARLHTGETTRSIKLSLVR